MYLSWLTSFGKATLSSPPPCWVTLSRARATSCSRLKPDLATPTTGQGSVPRRTMFCSAGNIFLKAKSPVAPKKTRASEMGAVDSGCREAWLGLTMVGMRASPSGRRPSTGVAAPDAPGRHAAPGNGQYCAQHHGSVKAAEQRRRLKPAAKSREARGPRHGGYPQKAGQPGHGV